MGAQTETPSQLSSALLPRWLRRWPAATALAGTLDRRGSGGDDDFLARSQVLCIPQSIGGQNGFLGGAEAASQMHHTVTGLQHVPAPARGGRSLVG
jgi:hypothetical protein